MMTPIFVSLGMVILDEIRFPTGKVLHNVAGGSGLYSTLGARMTDLAAARPGKVGCYVLAGGDFPDFVEQDIMSLGVAATVTRDPSKLSTRGLLKYPGESFEERSFEYTTPLLQPTPADLTGSPLLRSKAFRFLASPDLMLIFVRDLSKLRVAAGVASPPLVLWEPAPASCISGSQNIHLQTAKYVDVYSPNHLELLATFASGADDGPPAEFDRQRIEEQVRRVLNSGIGRNADGAAVIRCGEHGCMVAARSYHIQWFPAFHKLSASRIVDVTGAGNAFLGAFAVTLSITSDLTEATIAGSVVASFVIEQVGLPHKTTSQDGKDMWNGEAFAARVGQFRTVLETPANTSATRDHLSDIRYFHKTGTVSGSNLELKDWAVNADGNLTFNSNGLLACPNSTDGSWAIWVSVGIAEPGSSK